MHAMISPDSHLDHGIPKAVLAKLLDCDIIRRSIGLSLSEGPQGIWKTQFLVNDLPKYGVDTKLNIKCGLYGPWMGDPKIREDEVVYLTRGSRTNKSRMIEAPLRPSDMLSVIVGWHNDKPTLFTAFGGPIVPREPLPDADPNSEEAIFWRDHALATG